MDGLRERLRAATAPCHAAVDEAYSGYALDTVEGYRGFLLAHARALVPLEEALERAGIETLLPDWPARRRRAALAGDLQALGAALPEMPAVALPGDPAGLWGAAYVVEGSRMGSRMLGQRLRRAGHPWVAPALGYLCHRLDEQLWPGFVRRLEAHAADLAPEPLLAGARQAFALFLAAASVPTPGVATPGVATPGVATSDSPA